MQISRKTSNCVQGRTDGNVKVSEIDNGSELFNEVDGTRRRIKIGDYVRVKVRHSCY